MAVGFSPVAFCSVESGCVKLWQLRCVKFGRVESRCIRFGYGSRVGLSCVVFR